MMYYQECNIEVREVKLIKRIEVEEDTSQEWEEKNEHQNQGSRKYYAQA